MPWTSGGDSPPRPPRVQTPGPMTWFSARLGVYAAHCQLTDSIIRRAWALRRFPVALKPKEKGTSGRGPAKAA